MKSFARRSEMLGNGLLAASLFIVLVWWQVSLYCFLAGALLAVCSQLVNRDLSLPLGAASDSGAA